MDCATARAHLTELARGGLDGPLRLELQRHLDGCQACRAAAAADAALEALLRTTLPRPAAPPALLARLQALAAPPTTSGDRAPRAWAARAPVRERPAWRRLAGPALAMGVALAVPAALLLLRLGEARRAEARLVDELVADHLRVLAALRPAEIESGGAHQVKPWFEGRLDFAPTVPEPSGGDLALRGGAVGYVLDRRAAVLQYALRRHRLTLLVLRAEGLPWPAGPPDRATTRGFTVIRWRAGELGYALICDVTGPDLEAAATTLRTATGG